MKLQDIILTSTMTSPQMHHKIISKSLMLQPIGLSPISRLILRNTSSLSGLWRWYSSFNTLPHLDHSHSPVVICILLICNDHVCRIATTVMMYHRVSLSQNIAGPLTISNQACRTPNALSTFLLPSGFYSSSQKSPLKHRSHLQDSIA